MARIQRRQCAKCGLNRNIKFYPTPRARICDPCQRKTKARSAKHARITDTYGITIDEYETLYTRQHGQCGICGGKRPTLDIDHSHADERLGIPIRQTVRGLLCRRCNRRLLPAAQDNPAVLAAAISYLQQQRPFT